MSNLSSLLDRYKALVIFDTETSGLNPGDDQIIELAALRVERTQTGATERRNQWKQQKKGPPDATGRPLREHPAARQRTDPAPKV